MHTRDAVPADADAVVALLRQLARIEGQPCPLTSAYASWFLGLSAYHVLLAVDTDAVVGLLSYSLRPNLYHGRPCCLIDELVVDQDHRGRGIGSALVGAVIDRARAAGCAEVSVSALPGNDRALAFYRARGFGDEAVLLEQHFDGGADPPA